MINYKEEKGFSLVELLAVVAIIGIISAIALPNYFKMQKQFVLSGANQKLAHDIRMAQEMAMSAKTESGCPADSGYKFGYGVYFSLSVPSSYIIFADCNDNKNYDFSPTDKVIETITFENGVIISNLSPGDPLEVVFTPPTPAVTINFNSSNTNAEITITSEGKYKSVKVNKAGLIDD